MRVSLYSCHADLTVDTKETPTKVVITVTQRRTLLDHLRGAACADARTVQLAAPLGNRKLIDGSTGERMLIRND